MKILKKVIVCVITAMFTFLPTVPFVTLADAPYINMNKDPNGDSRLTIADMTFILQCLGGRYVPNDYGQLDINDNGVVSYVDALLVQMVDARVLK